MKVQKYTLAIWLVLACSIFASGQKPNSKDLKPPEGKLLKFDTLGKPPVYTTPLDFYHVRTPPIDSLDFETHQYDPTRRQYIYYGNLGNLGSAHRHQQFKPDKTKGLDYGQHQ